MFFRHGFLKENTIGVISQMGIVGHCNHLHEGLLWVLLQEINYPDLQHAHSTCGEKVLLKAPVDRFYETTNSLSISWLFLAQLSKKLQRQSCGQTDSVNGESLHPLLPFRHQGVLMFPLCHKCCVEKHEHFCQHEQHE